MKSSLGPPPARKDELRTLMGVLRRTKQERKEKKESSQRLFRLQTLPSSTDCTYISTTGNDDSVNLQIKQQNKNTTAAKSTCNVTTLQLF